MPGRRKLPEPLSPADAFWASIHALPPDGQGRARWERAAIETGLSISQLKKCATGERPIRMDHAETFDLINTLAGGPPDNEDSMRARRERALTKAEEPPTDPARYIEQAVTYIREAVRAIEYGRGGDQALDSMFSLVHKEQSALYNAISERKAQAALDRERRADDKSGDLRLVQRR